MADGGVGDVGARLRAAEQRRGQTAREKRLRALIADKVGPEALLLARRYLPEEPAAARAMERAMLALCERAVIAVLSEADGLRLIGPGRALLLDGKGGAEVIADPQIGGES